ncbi:hypothetical protein ACK36G_18925 [Aeromonas veronii]|uniref:hypothetical protein n=1 Tax=Aeromonas TaxID=642 RepID=UPI002E7C48E2|nr:hypothetical protein [Aeromonas caviae]MEE1913706.1 hypothetical protein [Aeromonas caviae]
MSTAVSTGISTSLRERILAKKKDIKAKSGLRADVLKIPMGKHKFRILPAHPDLGPGGDFWADFGQHYIKDLEDKTKAVYVCVDKTFGRPCGVCHALEAAGRSVTDDREVKAVADSQCKRAEIMLNVLHLNGDKPTVPQILQMTPSTFAKVLDLVEEYDDITDLQKGTDLIITREGSGLNTEYSVQPARTSNPVDASVLSNMTNLQEFILQESEEGARKAINQVNAIVGIIEAADFAPKPAISSRPAASKALPAIDMEVDAPVAKSSSPAPKAAAATAAIDSELDELMAVDEELLATGTDGAAASSKPAAGSASVDDLDALLGELDAL